MAAFPFESILKTAEAKYVCGLSATPVRQDGHQPIIFMQCGPIRYLVDVKSQVEKRPFSHFVLPKFIRMRLPSANGIQNGYVGVIENETRNELIVSDAQKLILRGGHQFFLPNARSMPCGLPASWRERRNTYFSFWEATGKRISERNWARSAAGISCGHCYRQVHR